MITVWMVYFVVAAIASGVFLVAGWRSKQAYGYTGGRAGGGVLPDPQWDGPLRDGPNTNSFVGESHADAATALRLVLKRLAPVMTNRFVQAEVAAAFGLQVRMRAAALADLLEEMLGVVIHAAPASRILLTAVEQGGQVAISITDDIPNANPDVRRAGARGLMERVARGGGALDLVVRPDEGTTMTLRLGAAGVGAAGMEAAGMGAAGENEENGASCDPANGLTSFAQGKPFASAVNFGMIH